MGKFDKIQHMSIFSALKLKNIPIWIFRKNNKSSSLCFKTFKILIQNAYSLFAVTKPIASLIKLKLKNVPLMWARGKKYLCFKKCISIL